LFVGAAAALVVESATWPVAEPWPLLSVLVVKALAASLVVLIPLSFGRRTRDAASGGLTLAAFVAGGALLFGMLALGDTVMGLAIGIGLLLMLRVAFWIVPLGVLLGIFGDGLWADFGEFAISTPWVTGMVAYARHMQNKVGRERVGRMLAAS
jgi:hypothetical protein